MQPSAIKEYISKTFLMMTEKLLEADEIVHYKTICMVFNDMENENIIRMPLDSFETTEITTANLELIATDFYVQ